jgi:N-methylhydantoinase A/acetophenone carboxylase
MPVFLSSEVAPRIYEYPRTMMTILNAYLHQSMYEELSGIGDELRDRGYRRPMMMIHNTGGMASVLRTSAVNTYNGGPVAGLMGSAYIGGVYGYSNVVASDMGGTSFDIGMVAAGSPRFYQFMPIIDRWVVDATIVDCHSIGAGGGSIARVNELIANRVEVGPESAGSMPGPAAYNQGGTQPTVTDADVVLGYVNPENFHGGRIRLNPRRAERALRDHIAEPLGVSIKDAALMVRRIVDANMGQAIRRETVLKGFDPREFILFAFGGAGPTHCCGYARFAEMEKIVVFPFAPTFCAFGSSTMDVVHVYERSHHLHLLHPATGMYMEDFESFNETVRGLREVALRDFAGEGYDPAEVTYELELDMKFGGQLNVKRVSSPLLELSTDADAVALRHAFEREYGDAYSPLGLNPEAGIEIHNFVLRGRVAQRRPELERHEFVSEDPSPALVSTREAHWEDLGTVATPVYSQELIRCGNAIDGPAIIEAEDTTVVIEPGWRYTLDTYLNGVMERRHSSADARPMAALAQATPD